MKRSIILVAGLAALLVGLGTTSALASVPDAGGVIHACIQPQNGNLTKIIDVDAGQRCGNNEQPLDWNQAGQQGPPGPQGPQGPAGEGVAVPLIRMERWRSDGVGNPSWASDPHFNPVSVATDEDPPGQYFWSVSKAQPCPDGFDPIDLEVTAISLASNTLLDPHRDSASAWTRYNRNGPAPIGTYANWIFGSGWTTEPANVIAYITCARSSYVVYDYVGQ